MLGRALGSGWLQKVDLVQSIELIFGIILVSMMLFRRQGLIPAIRPTPALSLEQQTAHAGRGGFASPIRGIESSKSEPKRAMLETRKLTRRYGGIVAVKELDLVVESNTIVALIGPNGSGKTTTFNLITGMDEPSSGKILLLDQDITGLPAHVITERGIARTFQNLRLFSNMTVMENILVAMHSRTTTGPSAAVLRTRRSRSEEKDAQERAVEIIEAFGNRLLPRTNQLVKELSYANRRRGRDCSRAGFAPEGTSARRADGGHEIPMETLELADQIRSLRTMGLTIFLIEHKLNVVNDLADKIIVLDHGEKIAEGSAEQVHSNPQVLEAYLGRKAAHA